MELSNSVGEIDGKGLISVMEDPMGGTRSILMLDQQAVGCQLVDM